MKHFKVWMIIAMLTVTSSIYAIPAAPKAVKIQQPDGSWTTIKLHGDEWLNFNTTEDGYSIVKNKDGYYVYAQLKEGALEPTKIVAHDVSLRSETEKDFVNKLEKYQRPDMNTELLQMKQLIEQQEAQKRSSRRNIRRAAEYDYSNFKGLIILVQYNDKSFSRDDYKTIITDMVNKENYSGFDSEQYTGSVHDYFSDNSLGKFKPQFDVYGPVTIDYSQYDANGTSGARKLINAAVDAADASINFKDYDRDNDGFVDLIYFIFAGNGANYGGNDSRLFWPHRSFVISTNGYYVTKDQVKLWDYASSTELKGYTAEPSTIKIDGIGTICHEFSHVLGLPDFYDTDYETNGTSNHPDDWSIMAGGSYFNDSRTPVGYSLYERWSVGFCNTPEEITTNNYTLNPLHLEQQGYKLSTPNSYEYFLFENRQQDMFKWDEYLPGTGLLVTRVESEGSSKWNSNKVNCDASHNYYELVRANGAHKDSHGNYFSSSSDVFPANGKTSLSNYSSPANLLTWDKKENSLSITDIKLNSSNGTITFTASGNNLTPISIADFKQTASGCTRILQLTDAEVLHVKDKTAYIRDKTGSIMLANMDLGLAKNNRINGTLTAIVNVNNKMPQALGIDNTTSAENLVITEGSEVLPREVQITELTEADYSDYVLVKAAKLKKESGVWALDDNNNKIARLYNTLGISGISLSDYDGNYFDIPAIFGTGLVNSSVVDELYMTASPIKVSDPTAISEIQHTNSTIVPAYNLNGQRVDVDYKGFVIVNGKKIIKK